MPLPVVELLDSDASPEDDELSASPPELVLPESDPLEPPVVVPSSGPRQKPCALHWALASQQLVSSAHQ